MKKYVLELTEKQAQRVMEALNLHTRLSCGQVSEINEITFEKDKDKCRVRVSQEVLSLLQREMFPSLSGLPHSYGIHSPKLPDEVRESYDIFKVMMYEFNKDNGPMNVYADKVTRASRKALPKFAMREK